MESTPWHSAQVYYFIYIIDVLPFIISYYLMVILKMLKWWKTVVFPLYLDGSLRYFSRGIYQLRLLHFIHAIWKLADFNIYICITLKNRYSFIWIDRSQRPSPPHTPVSHVKVIPHNLNFKGYSKLIWLVDWKIVTLVSFERHCNSKYNSRK